MLSLLLGCWVYKKDPDLEVHPGGQDLKGFEGTVGLAPVSFMADLNGDRDDFRDGVYVGTLRRRQLGSGRDDRRLRGREHR